MESLSADPIRPAHPELGYLPETLWTTGEPEPSLADELLTRRLKEALMLIDIRVLDHLVIGCGRSVSFAERGLL